MYTLFYDFMHTVMPKLAASLCSVAILFCVLLTFWGCKPSYAYCNLDTSAYSKDYQSSEIPQAPTVQLTKQTLLGQLPDYIEIKESIVYINAPELYNFEVQELTAFTLCFLSPAIATITGPLRTQGCAIIGTQLTLVLNANIYCGGEPTTIVTTTGQQSYQGAIIADNLIIQSNATVNCQNAAAIKANSLNIVSGNLVINGQTCSLQADNINIFGGELLISGHDGIIAQNINFYGAKTIINVTNIGIKCSFLHILNGQISLYNSKTAISCQNMVKTSGFLLIKGESGISCGQISINEGLLYASCKQACLLATSNINIAGGTNVWVSSGQNCAAIDADVPFVANGGLTVQNSDYVCKPTMGSYYGFKAQASNMFYLNRKAEPVIYMVEQTGSLCFCGNINATSYTTSGKLNNHKGCFFGLLMQPSVNCYGEASLPSNQCDLGAKWCNIGKFATAQGQLF